MRIVIVGGGSYGWGPTIIRDIAVTEHLAGCHIVLEDIDPEPLEILYPLGQKIVEAAGTGCTIEATTDQKEALTDADFVILTITTGGLDMMEHDIAVPLKYGIYQPVGDTVGPGGLMRALRNIPVVVDIARDIEKYAKPGCWLLNYTNPMTTICRAVTRETSVPTIGLCHELFGTLGMLQGIFGVDDWHRDITVKVGGINHLPWIVEMDVKGQDGFALLRKVLEKPTEVHQVEGLKLSIDTHKLDRSRVKFELFKVFGCLPAAGDRHLVEFFPYFCTEKTNAAADFGVALTTVKERREVWRAGAIENCKKMLSGETEISLERSGETASRIIAALSGGEPMIDVVNIPNVGQIDNLPRDAVVECMGTIDGTGVHGIAIGELPPGIAANVVRHVYNQEMTVEAALTGDRNLALQVLYNDPLLRDDWRIAPKMLDEMIELTKEYLPQFA